MKAERRHQLQTNSLNVALAQSSEWLRQHGAKVLLGVVVVALAIVLIYQRINTRRAQAEEAKVMLARAWDNIQELGRLNQLMLNRQYSDQVARLRKQTTDFATDSLGRVRELSQDRQTLAQAAVASGQLNWELANMPPVLGATTNPALRLPAESSHYLDLAQQEYQSILKDYPEQQPAVISAKFGLAAIAENRQQWSEAQKYYDELSQGADTAPAYKDLAQERAKLMVEAQKPVYLASTQPATQPAPTTRSILFGSANLAATQPTTAATQTGK